jgi:hypothetical protein
VRILLAVVASDMVELTVIFEQESEEVESEADELQDDDAEVCPGIVIMCAANPDIFGSDGGRKCTNVSFQARSQGAFRGSSAAKSATEG